MKDISMWHNGTNCDIYIGSGAGKQLRKNIHTARNSVKIISPYISLELIEDLILLKHKGVKVELITSKETQYNSKKNTRQSY